MQLKIGMECREVKRNVRSQIFQDPIGQFPRLYRIVIQGRNHQIGNLKPYRGLIFQEQQCVQHRLHVCQSNFAIEIFCERLQVDVRRIDVIVNIVRIDLRIDRLDTWIAGSKISQQVGHFRIFRRRNDIEPLPGLDSASRLPWRAMLYTARSSRRTTFFASVSQRTVCLPPPARSCLPSAL